MSKKTVLFVGDTAPKRPDMDSIFEKTTDYLHSCELLFGQLEAVVTDRGAPACQCRLPLRIYPSAGPCLKRAGFDVMSNAGNHVLDWGFEGFYDTMRIMKEAGIGTKAGAIVFSLPVTETAGMRLIEKNEDETD